MGDRLRPSLISVQRLLIIALAAGGLVGCGKPALPRPSRTSGSPTYQPRPGVICPNDGMVDFARVSPPVRLPPRPPGPFAEDSEVSLARMREALAATSIRAGASIRLYENVMLSPMEVRVDADRADDGRWFVRWTSASYDPPPTHRMKTVFLSPEQAAHLETLLRQPCLYLEPELVGNEFPATRGGRSSCYDGGNIVVDIIFEGRRRTAAQACLRYGLTGQVTGLLLSVAKDDGLLAVRAPTNTPP